MDWTRPLPLYSALAGRLDKRGEGGLPYENTREVHYGRVKSRAGNSSHTSSSSKLPLMRLARSAPAHTHAMTMTSSGAHASGKGNGMISMMRFENSSPYVSLPKVLSQDDAAFRASMSQPSMRTRAALLSEKSKLILQNRMWDAERSANATTSTSTMMSNKLHNNNVVNDGRSKSSILGKPRHRPNLRRKANNAAGSAAAAIMSEGGDFGHVGQASSAMGVPVILSGEFENSPCRQVLQSLNSRKQRLSVIRRLAAVSSHIRQHELHDIASFIASIGRPRERYELASSLVAGSLFFTAIRACSGPGNDAAGLMSSIIADVRAAIVLSLEHSEEVGGASGIWYWPEVDRTLMMTQFAPMSAVTAYRAVRPKLMALGVEGMMAIGRLERNLILTILTHMSDESSGYVDNQVSRDISSRSTMSSKIINDTRPTSAATTALIRAVEHEDDDDTEAAGDGGDDRKNVPDAPGKSEGNDDGAHAPIETSDTLLPPPPPPMTATPDDELMGSAAQANRDDADAEAVTVAPTKADVENGNEGDNCLGDADRARDGDATSDTAVDPNDRAAGDGDAADSHNVEEHAHASSDSEPDVPSDGDANAAETTRKAPCDEVVADVELTKDVDDKAAANSHAATMPADDEATGAASIAGTVGGGDDGAPEEDARGDDAHVDDGERVHHTAEEIDAATVGGHDDEEDAMEAAAPCETEQTSTETDSAGVEDAGTRLDQADDAAIRSEPPSADNVDDDDPKGDKDDDVAATGHDDPDKESASHSEDVVQEKPNTDQTTPDEPADPDVNNVDKTEAEAVSVTDGHQSETMKDDEDATETETETETETTSPEADAVVSKPVSEEATTSREEESMTEGGTAAIEQPAQGQNSGEENAATAADSVQDAMTPIDSDVKGSETAPVTTQTKTPSTSDDNESTNVVSATTEPVRPRVRFAESTTSSNDDDDAAMTPRQNDNEGGGDEATNGRVDNDGTEEEDEEDEKDEEEVAKDKVECAVQNFRQKLGIEIEEASQKAARMKQELAQIREHKEAERAAARLRVAAKREEDRQRIARQRREIEERLLEEEKRIDAERTEKMARLEHERAEYERLRAESLRSEAKDRAAEKEREAATTPPEKKLREVDAIISAKPDVLAASITIPKQYEQDDAAASTSTSAKGIAASTSSFLASSTSAYMPTSSFTAADEVTEDEQIKIEREIARMKERLAAERAELQKSLAAKRTALEEARKLKANQEKTTARLVSGPIVEPTFSRIDDVRNRTRFAFNEASFNSIINERMDATPTMEDASPVPSTSAHGMGPGSAMNAINTSQSMRLLHERHVHHQQQMLPSTGSGLLAALGGPASSLPSARFDVSTVTKLQPTAAQKTLGGVAGAMTTGAVGAGVASMPSSTSLAVPPMAPLSGIVGGPAMPMAMHHHPAHTAGKAAHSVALSTTETERLADVMEYAVYLGMDPIADKDLFYIAEWAINAPLPEGWTEHLDEDQNEFYHNSMTGVSTYEHPLDEQYRAYYRQIKQQRQSIVHR